MIAYYKEKCPKLSYSHMDARSLAYEDDSFDVVVDKGCLDSILCGEDGAFGAKKLFQEINRVLTPKGVYICVTYGQPVDNERDRKRYLPYGVFTERLKYFEDKSLGWNITTHMIAKPFKSATASVKTDQARRETIAQKEA